MNGLDKVATVLLTLDPTVAGELLQRFEKAEMTQVIDAMLAMQYVDHDTVQRVLGEFSQLCGQEFQGVAEPKARALNIIEKALDENEVRALLASREGSHEETVPFAGLAELDKEELADLLVGEQPQTIAVALTNLPAEKAGEALSCLPQPVAVGVVRCLATAEESVPPSVVASIGRALSARAGSLADGADPWTNPQRRYDLVASLLDAATSDARDAALEEVQQVDPDVAKAVRDRMFLFEDLVLLDAEALRKVIGAVDSQALALALKGADESLVNHVFSGLSKRAAESLRDEQELLGRKPMAEVLKAQAAVLEAVRRLRADGQITVRRQARAQEQLV